MKWYQLEIDEVLENLDTSGQGLTDAEATERRERYGPNKLAEEEKISKLKVFLHQFMSPLIYILIVAAVVSAFIEEYKDAAIIGAVVILNAVIGFIQEYKAEASVRALKKMVTAKARVYRNGREVEIDSEELVPGDIVLLASGSRVPADLRLFNIIDLRIEEAMLTGESIPAEKVFSRIEEENLPPGDQKNMAFMGTVVVGGRGRGVVVETGTRTVFGRIAKDVREVRLVRAPLQEKIDRFATAIGLIVMIAAAVLFIVGMLVGERPRDMFLTAIAAAVATIPEGLPIVVTIALSIGVSRMARRNAIIRNLPAVETLGSTTVICSDKTGTLTRNEMTVTRIYDGESIYEVTGIGYEPVGEILQNGTPAGGEALQRVETALRIGLLCNESNIYEEEGHYKVNGDPTEGALIVSAMKAGLDPEVERRSYSQVAMIPFESDRGYMATLHEHEGRKWIFVKGAPERLLELCHECASGDWKSIPRVADGFAGEGLRVLAMAFKEVPPEYTEIDHRELRFGLIFAGLQGMIDPPRPEAIEAVAGCRRAGIRVVMITGDHAITAEAIAKQLGIETGEPEAPVGENLEALSDEELFSLVKETAAVVVGRTGIPAGSLDVQTEHKVAMMNDTRLFKLIKDLTLVLVKRARGEGYARPYLTGRELESMSDEELFNQVQRVTVFARISPHHKHRIVRQLIERGEIVAVTGDGVNDAPALKAAHIGVAMGRGGTDVAREASDMVIADDNFTSIYNAVEEGRVVFDNIRKVTFFLIPTGIAAIISILGSVMAGLPIPYLPAQLLWINLVTNGLQDVALAFEPGEKDVTSRPPRDPQAGIISRVLVERTVIVGLLISAGVLYEFIHVLNQNLSLERARTIAVTVMVFFQFFQAWNSRSEMQSIFRTSPVSNPFLFFGLIAALGAHLAVLYAPPLQWLFQMEPIGVVEWLRILGISVTVIIVVEIDKLLRRRGILAAD